MIKILYIVPNLYTLSGVTNVIMNYYRKIDKEKIKIDFFVIKKYEDSVENELLSYGSKIYYMNNKIKLKNIFKVKQETNNFYKKHKYDIVELHAPTFSFLFMKEAKKTGIPIRIIHTHSTNRSNNKTKNILSFLLNINMIKYSNLYFSCSQKSGEYWYGKKMCLKDNYYVINNGIDISNYKNDKKTRKKIRKELDIEDKFVVGFVGRMSKDKNLFFLIDVMKKVVEKNNNVKLVIVGDGNISEQVKKYAEKLGDYVLFTGVRKDVNKVLNCFDVLLLPSKHEGLPMVAVEAQVTNIPCLLSNTITREVDLGMADFLPLNEEIWIEKILTFNRKNNEVDRDKFNIVKCVLKLENIYYHYYNRIGE